MPEFPTVNHNEFTVSYLTCVPDVNKVVPNPIQETKSDEYAIEFVPLPTATHKEPL